MTHLCSHGSPNYSPLKLLKRGLGTHTYLLRTGECWLDLGFIFGPCAFVGINTQQRLSPYLRLIAALAPHSHHHCDLHPSHPPSWSHPVDVIFAGHEFFSPTHIIFLLFRIVICFGEKILVICKYWIFFMIFGKFCLFLVEFLSVTTT